MRVAAVLCEVWLGAANRVEKLRMKHHEEQRIRFALDLTDSHEYDEHYAVSPYLTSEDEYFDNRERLRGLK